VSGPRKAKRFITMASAAKVFGATLAMHNRFKAMPTLARVVTSAFDGCKR